MKLLVVIVNYKVTDLTVDCLKSLSGQIHDVPGTHVAVCENGTGPEAVEQIRLTIDREGWGAWVTLTAIHPNRGFTGGNNAILQEALAWKPPPEYLLLLNADTIAHAGAIKALIDFMDANPQVGIGGSRLESPDGSAQCSAFRFQNPISEFDGGLRLGIVSRILAPWWVCPPIPAEPCPAEWVSGACMIIRRAVLENIGLLDEGLYTYFDDIDYCLRARRAGWSSWYVPASRVVHLGGMSTGIGRKNARPGRRPTYWFQARRRHFLKNYGPMYAALCDAAYLIGFSLWRVRRIIQRKPDLDPPHMLWDFFRNSVFCTGFQVRPVPNPALIEAAGCVPADPSGTEQEGCGAC